MTALPSAAPTNVVLVGGERPADRTLTAAEYVAAFTTWRAASQEKLPRRRVGGGCYPTSATFDDLVAGGCAAVLLAFPDATPRACGERCTGTMRFDAARRLLRRLP